MVHLSDAFFSNTMLMCGSTMNNKTTGLQLQIFKNLWLKFYWIVPDLLEMFCNANPTPKMLCFWKALTSKQGLFWR